MSDKVYEMDDHYNQGVAALLEFIKQRDELAENLKIAPPELIPEGQQLLADMDKRIEDYEAALAREYETYQNKCRAEENVENMNETILERMAMVYIYFKHRIPEKLEELEAIVLNNNTPEEAQAFYDRVAILEATKLEEIIAEEERK